MLKHWMLGAAAVAISISPALAADPIGDENVHDWTGFYAGVQGGADWASFTSTSGPGGHQLADIDPISGDGWVLGGSIGGDWQIDSFVFGIEGQANWTDADASFVDPADEEWHANIDWYAAISARFGVSFDQALFYAKGGLVLAGMTLDGVDKAHGGGTATASNQNYGYLAGVGLEFALGDNFSIFGEYEYFGLNPSNYAISGTGNLADEAMQATAHVVKAGIRIRN